MNTKIYHRRNAATDNFEWFWCERLNGRGLGPEHGPFDTRKEAADAAKSARITARGEKVRTS